MPPMFGSLMPPGLPTTLAGGDVIDARQWWMDPALRETMNQGQQLAKPIVPGGVPGTSALPPLPAGAPNLGAMTMGNKTWQAVTGSPNVNMLPSVKQTYPWMNDPVIAAKVAQMPLSAQKAFHVQMGKAADEASMKGFSDAMSKAPSASDSAQTSFPVDPQTGITDYRMPLADQQALQQKALESTRPSTDAFYKKWGDWGTKVGIHPGLAGRIAAEMQAIHEYKGLPQPTDNQIKFKMAHAKQLGLLPPYTPLSGE